jgi:cytochrome bd-type quinol oxidase subunit 2
MVTVQAQPTQEAREIASVLLGIQGCLFLVAGLGALPFGIVEPWMRLLCLATLVLAGCTFWLARGVRRHRRWARRWTVGFESFCVIGTLLVSLLPIEALNGPVPTLTNLLLPATIAGLLLMRSGREAEK